MRRYTTISIFSGAMGLDAGLHQTGRFEVLAAVEKEPSFCATIRANRDSGLLPPRLRVVQADIRDVDPLELLASVGLEQGELDLLVGGPPCQSFSTAGRRGTTQDARGALLWEFLRFVDAMKPKFFLMENVRGLLSAALRHRRLADRPEEGGRTLSREEGAGSVVELFADDLRRIVPHYHMDCFEVNAVNYGAPQLRERAIFIGNRFDVQVDFPDPTHGKDHGDEVPVADLFDARRLAPWATSPFVLMFYSKQRGYSHVSDIEKDIVPAKVFSSMETSAGRMVEEVVLPFYGWQVVPTQMHSAESLLDGRKLAGDDHSVVTLKSGPRCLNDEMAQQIGRDIAANVSAWAERYGADKVDFTYGVLYGTKSLSNKKDWHVLRSLAEVLPADASVSSSHRKAWAIRYAQAGLEVTATVRIGLEWWDYLGDRNSWIEVCVALIRACVLPAGGRDFIPDYAIVDLPSILDLSGLPDGYNVSLLQESQFEWLLFLARHFCDELVD